jgi:hypothetical protein
MKWNLYHQKLGQGDLGNIVSPVFGAEDSGMMVDSVFASLKNGFVYCQGSKYKTYFRDFV